MAGSKGGDPGEQARLLIVWHGDIPVAVPTPMDDLEALLKLSSEMKSVCEANKGKGLSAVQVGVPWDLFVIKDLPKSLRSDGERWGIFVGCKYKPVGTSQIESVEGCLSLKTLDGRLRFYTLKRYVKVRVSGYRLVGARTPKIMPFDEILDVKRDSIVFQHEIDHSFGILISSKGKEVLGWS